MKTLTLIEKANGIPGSVQNDIYQDEEGNQWEGAPGILLTSRSEDKTKYRYLCWCGCGLFYVIHSGSYETTATCSHCGYSEVVHDG